MGLIESTIRLRNEMTGVIDNVIRSMDMVISSAYDVKTETGHMFDTKSLDAAKDSLNEATAVIKQNQIEQQNFNNEIKKGEQNASSLTDMLKRAAVALGVAQGVKSFVGLSDDFTLIKARLDGINDGQQSTAQLQEMIFHSAQRSRGEYMMTMDIVSKLGAQAKSAFKTNQETVQFAENMNKLFTISGTSAQGVESVMYNLTQAMATGVLRGQDLNAVMSNTPELLHIVAKYMDEPIEKIRDLAADGELSALAVKNALLGATDEINAKFGEIPMTFGQIATALKNEFIHAIEPATQYFNEFLNSDNFQVFVNNAMVGIEYLSMGITQLVESVVWIGNAVSENWETIQPILMAIITLYAAWKGITFAVAVQQAILNAVLYANPVVLLIGGIAALIVWIIKWIQSVGGIQIAWLITVDKVLTGWDKLKIGFTTGVNWVLNWADKMDIGIAKMAVAIDNSIGDMKVKTLTKLQDWVNDGIEKINTFIENVNKIPGVKIDTIQKLTFATEAHIANEAEKQARNQELQDYENEKNAQILARENKLSDMRMNMLIDHANRSIEIQELQAKKRQSENDKSQGNKVNDLKYDVVDYKDLPAIAKDAKKIKDNTKKLKDGISVKNDDISYLKDLAEMRAIQNFKFDKIEVTANNSFGDVYETADLDGWIDNLTDELEDSVETTMGGVPSFD